MKNNFKVRWEHKMGLIIMTVLGVGVFFVEAQTSNSSCIVDVSKLSHMAFDSNPDAHRYSKLLESSLNELFKIYPDKGDHHYYSESLDEYIHIHIKQIYDYAQSLGTTFNSNIRKKRRLKKDES